MTSNNFEEKRKSQRMPLSSLVKLEFKDFREFIKLYSKNISEDGMFVNTDFPKPVGSIVNLELRLKDYYELINGVGQVVRIVKSGKEKGEIGSGMAIKFLTLTTKSKELIKKIANENIKISNR